MATSGAGYDAQNEAFTPDSRMALPLRTRVHAWLTVPLSFRVVISATASGTPPDVSAPVVVTRIDPVFISGLAPAVTNRTTERGGSE